jgi:periplasmic divalent cation tolerance protein
MDFALVYITCPNPDVANQLARGAVQSRLAACANIIPGMTSIYEWNNALQIDQEAILIVKTRSNLVELLTSWVAEHHPYTVPCILQIPILSGSDTYLKWLTEQTRDRNDE